MSARSCAKKALFVRRIDLQSSITSVLLAGVGGQGILRASDILSAAALEAGYDVKKSEVHGMAQRGGCVTSHVRFGSKVYSPIAKKGDIDILVSFEKMEILRYLDYLKAKGTVIINDEEIYPPAVNLGELPYPQGIFETTRKIFRDVKVLNAGAIAAKAGNRRAANTVLLGALSTYLSIEEEIWAKILEKSFPPRVLKDNIEAFHLGRAA